VLFELGKYASRVKRSTKEAGNVVLAFLNYRLANDLKEYYVDLFLTSKVNF